MVEGLALDAGQTPAQGTRVTEGPRVCGVASSYGARVDSRRLDGPERKVTVIIFNWIGAGMAVLALLVLAATNNGNSPHRPGRARDPLEYRGRVDGSPKDRATHTYHTRERCEAAQMKAIVQRGYGAPEDVLELQEIEKPAVEDDEVLVRARAASVHPDVWHVVTGRPYVLRLMGAGLRAPKIPVPGTDVAGRVESVGKHVTQFRPGDEVFGESVRGHQWKNGGAYAEYVSVREGALAHKPAHVTFEQAAAVATSGLIALENLRVQGRLQAGQKVLINGAAGGVGAVAVQLAKAYGAEVTGVDATAKLDMVLSLGADRVLDYRREDFTRGSERYDLILDIPGNHSLSECRRVLTPNGIYVLVGHDRFGAGGRWVGLLAPFLRLTVMTPFVSQLPRLRNPRDNTPPLAVLKDLMQAGKLTPVVDRTFALSEVLPAMRYLAEGHARGKVVITVASA
jgi:NADPH:quinone reductase-like Zn-dependent oxidoreductase